MAFSKRVVGAHRIGSQGARKINFIFPSFLAWLELSAFLKQPARQDGEASFPVLKVNYLSGAEFIALMTKLSKPSLFQ